MVSMFPCVALYKVHVALTTRVHDVYISCVVL